MYWANFWKHSTVAVKKLAHFVSLVLRCLKEITFSVSPSKKSSQILRESLSIPLSKNLQSKINSGIRQQHQNMQFLCNTVPVHLHIKYFNSNLKLILKHLSTYIWYHSVGKKLQVYSGWLVLCFWLTYSNQLWLYKVKTWYVEPIFDYI